METALDLFDWDARRSDPETSHIAAEELSPRLRGLRLQFVEALTQLGQATANEVAAFVTSDPHLAQSIRKRAKEIERHGFIRVVGVRACKQTGSKASVYEVVAK
ncbi:hypothetical protein VN12_19840 [Pirellula sp. SH-Sr6A]|uniref:hypothetical protein n=1 Tax=Pirellula sp. SH-Sr6A TaxID=1632865 RepID=UPI00078E70FA|nr:hypothetical protein [Pirellula sp. SH-Sr6A]AMV34387.1 hypothetical protein VN12_19840 [Pirellula sp. SH-Sr6A]